MGDTFDVLAKNSKTGKTEMLCQGVPLIVAVRLERMLEPKTGETIVVVAS